MLGTTNPAWIAFAKEAPHNQNLADFRKYTELANFLIHKQPFQIARYNDGEWVFMLKIEPHYSNYITRSSYPVHEVEEISNKLIAIIDSRPPYYIGVDSTTQAGVGSISREYDTLKAKLQGLNVVYGEIFNAATVMYGLNALKNPLSQRFVITVGPDYMQRLALGVEHISVPPQSCWTAADAVSQKVEELLSKNLAQQPVVLYSCSLLAKWLVDVMFLKFGDSITQLDIGSCIDPWCGVNTRPWHALLIDQYAIPPVIAEKKPRITPIQVPPQKLLPKPVPTPPIPPPISSAPAAPPPITTPLVQAPIPPPTPIPTPPPPILTTSIIPTSVATPTTPITTKNKKTFPPAPPVLPTSISTGLPAPVGGYGYSRQYYTRPRKKITTNKAYSRAPGDRSGSVINETIFAYAHCLKKGLDYVGACGYNPQVPNHFEDQYQLSQMLGLPLPVKFFPAQYLGHTEIRREDYLPDKYPDINVLLDSPFIEKLRASYRAHNPQHQPTKNTLRAAMHIRRGDVKIDNKMRYVPNEYYLTILTKLRELCPNLEVSIFSESESSESFQEFTALGCHLFLDEDLAFTWKEMIAANILVMSKGSFSYVPALYNPNFIIYQPAWYAKLAHWHHRNDSNLWQDLNTFIQNLQTNLGA